MDLIGSGKGNTKTFPKKRQGLAKRHVFTWNNYPENYMDLFKVKFENCKWMCGEEIAPETGTPHLQGYIEHVSKCRPIERYKLSNEIHWEAAKSCRATNIAYCMKEHGSKNGNLVPEVIKILESDCLYNYQKEIESLCLEEPDDRSIHWYWDKKGNIGKSALVKYLVVKYGAIMISGKAADMKYSIQQYVITNGKGPKIILVDIPRTSMKFLSYAGMEEVKNGCFFSGKFEGGMVVYNNPHIICFANEKPDTSTMSKDRWVVTKLKL